MRACLISRPRVKNAVENGDRIREEFSQRIHSNNLLAVEPESENDAPAKVVKTKLFQTDIVKQTSVGAAASGDNKRD